MSASLVGSEMCIRDRGRTLRQAIELAAERQPPPYGREAIELAAERQPPVSYTHLTLPTICSV
eukprot:13014947-Alexandrium_andersonii.AAC.1